MERQNKHPCDKKRVEEFIRRIEAGDRLLFDPFIEELKDAEDSENAALGSTVRKLIKRYLRPIVTEIVEELNND